LKYRSEDYFSVIEIKTGRKICDCADELDALMMVSFDPTNRTITRNQFLMGQVVDIEIQKQLPTSNISVSTTKEGECTTRKKQLEDITPNKLPQSNLEPLNLKL
jgi:hypothetical protein